MTPSPKIEAGLQHTIKSEIGCSGTGLHTGETVSILLKPAPANTGIVFRRTDQIGNGTEIPALVENVVEATLCTTLGDKDGVTIATVEHLLAALAGCLIDNAIVEVDGSEVPIMDGSAAPFVFLIECAGTIAQDTPRRTIEVLKHVDVELDGRQVSLSPGNGFSVGFEIDFDSNVIGRQDMNVRLVNGTFKGQISRARTFGFVEEVDQLRRMGLALGGSLDNAVVVSGDEILNDEGLRYEDEFVRHKILDCVGDLYLAGAPISGHFEGYRSGHAMNHEIVRALFADPSAWRYTEMSAVTESGIEPQPLAATA
ncbi:MAG: UDP-3-O-[3-hydroxymyristoyl] N-acetylglucosamine deacetylase [Alphaproteobacteria bacterium]|nr:UDP-3-O-[3-hydroxymyristoyl] N-acetylglucosamine deacetylase [Alphaproteobacteria bacterium]HCP00828.1 UDP-3-O-[3-hydroxymyristoyl] N-acetylglucosamine deacetylase [Rhodospirillaceae bacterium]